MGAVLVKRASAMMSWISLPLGCAAYPVSSICCLLVARVLVRKEDWVIIRMGVCWGRSVIALRVARSSVTWSVCGRCGGTCMWEFCPWGGGMMIPAPAVGGAGEGRIWVAR